MDEQQQELAAFERSIRGESEVEPAAGPAPVVEPEAEAPADQPETVEPEQPEVTSEAPAAPTDGVLPAEKPQAEEDPEVFDGFKRSELKRLVESASEVESLKQRLRRAEGKVGELNSRLQDAPKPVAPAPTQHPAELPAELKQFAQDYPDVYSSVQALIQMQQPQPQPAPPVAPHEPVAAGTSSAQAELDPEAIELAVMDRMHQGWREKVLSSAFGSWLTSQGDEVRQAYHGAQTASDLAGVVGRYDAWSAARQEQAEKASKGQQRLRSAVTPTGTAQRPQAAMTEEEAFRAALRS